MRSRFLFLVALVTLFAFPLLAATHVVVFSGTPPADFQSRVVALGGSVVFVHADAGVASVEGLSDSAAAALEKSSGIRIVEPDQEFTIAPASLDSAELAEVEPNSAADPTSAYFYARQWHLRQIGAPAAWAAGKLGSPAVTVAVLDTGIAYTCPDLQGRVDLSRSVSFQPGDDAVVAALFPGLDPITDLYFHGTHVSATISSNGLVGAGVTSGVTLMGVKVLNYQGSGSTTSTVRGILWAADHGADVINMSLGGGFAKNGAGRLVAYLNQATNYAYRKGALVVVSAGNSAWDLDHDGNTYISYCNAPNVVCVSATGPLNYSLAGPWVAPDTPADYTNYGRSAISVAAPGGFGSYVYEACSNTSLAIPVCQTGNYILGASGTSMAAPHVSGLAALIVGEIGHGNPARVRARLLQSADDLGQPGTDPFYGKGRINVPRALGLE
ncbi:MAG: S8 family serine peptidase [Thermoanaerobaculia bacterium]